HRSRAFIAGGIAACGAVTATHPFETVKIRMQLQGELQTKGHQPHHYRGPIHGVSVIVRNEGLKGIYRGIGCAYIYQVLLNGCRLGFYEPMRSTLTPLLFRGDSKTQSLGVNMFCGASSGIIGAAAGSPFFLVKTRLQSFSPFLPVGTQHKYRNALDGLRQIYGAEGIRGLYRGVGAAMIRTGFGSSVQLPTYFFAKRRLVRHLGMEEGAPLHLASSSISGFVVCVFMHPPAFGRLVGANKLHFSVDTIMSRLYNQNGNLYKGVFDCLGKTIRTEGLLAIYKGFLPHLARILPHTILTLSLAEQTNKLMRKFESRILPSSSLPLSKA
ncbi:mitochondrial carrier, partial [Apiospora phragmitis]